MKILAFGEVMMRMMPPDYKTLTQTDILEFVFTGTGVNILSGLYQMGHEVYLATKLPDNAVGKAAKAHIRKLGIKDDFVCLGGNHIGVYFLEKGYGNRASQVTYLNRKESAFGQSHMNDYDFSCLDGMDALHMCGISLAMNHEIREIAFRFVEEAKKRNIKVIFDCNFRPSLWSEEARKHAKEIYEKMLEQSDIVFAGIKDAKLLLELNIDDSLDCHRQLAVALEKMSNQYHINTIFSTQRITNKLQGFVYHNHELIKSKTYELTVYDRIGGGDGFAAGAIHEYFCHFSLDKLINYASISGMLAHTTYGDSSIVGEDEIIDYMQYGQSDVKR